MAEINEKALEAAVQAYDNAQEYAQRREHIRAALSAYEQAREPQGVPFQVTEEEWNGLWPFWRGRAQPSLLDRLNAILAKRQHTRPADGEVAELRAEIERLKAGLADERVESEARRMALDADMKTISARAARAEAERDANTAAFAAQQDLLVKNTERMERAEAALARFREACDWSKASIRDFDKTVSWAEHHGRLDIAAFMKRIQSALQQYDHLAESENAKQPAKCEPTTAELAEMLGRHERAIRATAALAMLDGSRWKDGEDIRLKDALKDALKALDGKS